MKAGRCQPGNAGVSPAVFWISGRLRKADALEIERPCDTSRAVPTRERGRLARSMAETGDPGFHQRTPYFLPDSRALVSAIKVSISFFRLVRVSLSIRSMKRMPLR